MIGMPNNKDLLKLLAGERNLGRGLSRSDFNGAVSICVVDV
jgi:hypothetical protein